MDRLVAGGEWSEALHDLLRSSDLTVEDVERDLGVIERYRGLAAEVDGFDAAAHEEKRLELQREMATVDERIGELQDRAAQLEGRGHGLRLRLSAIRRARNDMGRLRAEFPNIIRPAPANEAS